MNFNPYRRMLLLATAAMPFADSLAGSPEAQAFNDRFASLEAATGKRLGVYAIDTGNGNTLSWRAMERFPFCSTFKLMLAAAILDKTVRQPQLLHQRIDYAGHSLQGYSPMTEKHQREGMSIADLCAATVQYSDNTAANLLLAQVGGPAGLTAFARSIGDDSFRLDRIETALNTALPGDVRDTSTPMAMAHSLQRLALGDALPEPQRRQLCDWLRGNTTGAARIRAGVPTEWVVGDKTGTGDFGTANDVAVLWPPQRAPLLLAVYSTGRHLEARARDDVIAEAARIFHEWSIS
jgi:beta-lactamase class A